MMLTLTSPLITRQSMAANTREALGDATGLTRGTTSFKDEHIDYRNIKLSSITISDKIICLLNNMSTLYS